MSSGRAPLSSGSEGHLFRMDLRTAQPDTITEMLWRMCIPWRADTRMSPGPWIITQYILSDAVDINWKRKLSASTLVPAIFQIITELGSKPHESFVMSNLGGLVFMLVTLSKVGINDSSEPWPHTALAKEQLPVVFDTIWIHRSVFLDATAASDDINKLVSVLQANMATLETLYIGSLRSADERVPPVLLKVSLYAWTHGGRSDHYRVTALLLLTFSSEQGSDDDIRSALEDESDVIAIIRAASTALADEEVLNDDLCHILNILRAVFRVSAIAHRVLGSSDPNAPGVIELILGACQRQMCMGDDDTMERERIFFHVSSVALFLIGHVIAGLASTSAQYAFDSPHLVRYRKVVGKKNVLPVFAKFVSSLSCMPLQATVGEPSARELVNAIAAILEFQALVVNEYGPAISRANIEKVKFINSNWYPVVKLRLKTFSPNESDRKTFPEIMLSIWERYGEALGLEEIKVDPVVVLTSIRCGWKSCLCHHMNMAHRMKVCKGCFQVYYCTEYCQKIDWKEGHRAICKARTERNSPPIHGT
ncbi:hypothetical protein BDW22DRAFT_1168590 [Trametopsis cervina]|nr:hypothetical protein BDW22DRAFT_1168590 [Trametopsis cervina]